MVGGGGTSCIPITPRNSHPPAASVGIVNSSLLTSPVPPCLPIPMLLLRARSSVSDSSPAAGEFSPIPTFPHLVPGIADATLSSAAGASGLFTRSSSSVPPLTLRCERLGLICQPQERGRGRPRGSKQEVALELVPGEGEELPAGSQPGEGVPVLPGSSCGVLTRLLSLLLGSADLNVSGWGGIAGLARLRRSAGGSRRSFLLEVVRSPFATQLLVRACTTMLASSFNHIFAAGRLEPLKAQSILYVPPCLAPHGAPPAWHVLVLTRSRPYLSVCLSAVDP